MTSYRTRMRTAMAIALVCASAGTARAVERWAITVGETTLTLNPRATSTHELWIEPLGAAAEVMSRDAENLNKITYLVDTQSDFVVTQFADGAMVLKGAIMHQGGLALGGPQGQRSADTFFLSAFEITGNAVGVARDNQDPSRQTIIVSNADVQFDRVAQTLVITSDDVLLSSEWAAALHQPMLAKESIGSIVMQARLTSLDGHDVAQVPTVAPLTNSTVAAAAIGPDVIVGDLPNLASWGSEGGIAAFSVGTTSCNMGDEQLKWVANTNEHPVIGQNMYRLKDNRFEQIGQSWLKHGFTALQMDVCQLGCQPSGTGTRLGVGCSDPYHAGLNGSQNLLGERSEVNAFTGLFSYHRHDTCSVCSLLERRIQVHDADLDPALNPGAVYFSEGQYVAADDALSGNGENNASYRKTAVFEATGDGSRPCPQDFTAGEFCAQFVTGSTTQREQPAIRAWHAHDATVVETDVRVPNEGLFILAAKAINLGAGTWEYEYALHNLNSNRSCGSFSLPLPVGSVVFETGFHDVDYHSGEIYDGTDWAVTTTDSVIIWATESYDTNASANALRWGTLYNFRFRTNVAPGDTTATLGLFRPGSPDSVTATTIGPAVGLADCNANGVPDSCDLDCLPVGCDPLSCGGSPDCNRNGVPDECEPDCNGNGIADACDITGGTSADCEPNGVPDSCEADCDGDGIPDDCDTPDDCDGDGIEDCADLCRCTSMAGACVCPDLDRCCFSTAFCIDGFPRLSCISQGGTPDCVDSPCNAGCMLSEINGDFDRDGDSDVVDSGSFYACFSGAFNVASFVEPSAECLARFDYDGNHAIDLNDFKQFQATFSGPLEPVNTGGP